MDFNRVTGQAPPAAGHVWRFGDCEFDELRRELRVGGTAVEIESKPLEVLHQLVLHAGEVVTKDELLEGVWPGLMVVDGSLATAVSKLRKALGNESLVVTLPRVGYRLAVPVQTKARPQPDWAELQLKEGDAVPGRDQWRLARRLDLSPSSEVWLAEHAKTHESRVFKFAPDGARLRSLKREVTLARLLRESLGERPEFVRILEWNFTNQPYFLESEYVGPNLAEWAESQGGLHGIPLEQRLQLLADVARAVASAHEVDVLHKDLKPGNILVENRPDGKSQIKIADFGSAALLVPARLGALGITNLGFTQAGTADGGSLTGTLLYVAPEVLAGHSPTAASDVYALGVLLYQLTSGDFRKPLAPGWENDIADSLIREDIALAASGDPVRRLKSAAEFANRLLDLDRRRVERNQGEQAQERAAIAARNRAEARARLPWLVVAGVVLLVAVSGLGLYTRSRSVTPRLKTVAVLPFRNVGSDASIDFLRLALPDEIATILSRTRGLAVRPSGTTSQYGQPGFDAQRAGRELHVDRVVTGHFLRAGAQLHISLEAIDVESNRAVWRERLEAPAESMIATQMQLALRVQRSLVPSFGVSAASSTAQPKHEEAYNLFLRSAALQFDASHNAEALGLLERAVELDPSYPPAWHALARRYYGESRYNSGNSAMMEKWRSALERVLALDPDYVPAAAGFIRGRLEQGNLLESYRDAEDLVRRHPDSVDAHFSLSYVLRFAGLLQESASHCETAFLLDARTQTSGLRSCAIAFIQLADYPRALNYLHLDLGSGYTKALSIDMLVRQGKEQEALHVGSPKLPQWVSYDMLLACVQRKPLAEIRTLAGAVRPSEDPEANFLFAAHFAYCGDTEASADMLKRAIKGKYCSYPAIDSDPLFASLRTKPEYAEIRASAQACQRDFLERR